MDVYAEIHNSKGRCGILAKTDLYIYVLELKLDGTASEALIQIRGKGYFTPHAADSRKKMAVGISFSSKDRQVVDYDVDEY